MLTKGQLERLRLAASAGEYVPASVLRGVLDHIDELQALSVTKVLLAEGDGYKLYAKTVADVTAFLVGARHAFFSEQARADAAESKLLALREALRGL